MAEESIHFIGTSAMKRAIETIGIFKKELDDHQVDAVSIVGTAAIRRASNAHELIQKVKNAYGLDIEVISGLREAELIAQGTRLAFNNVSDNILVMDIGGGSVEFIIMNQNEIFWHESYPVGVAILKKKFHKSEPITQIEINVLEDFLKQKLIALKNKCLEYQPKILVGASGSFEVLSRIANPGDTNSQQLQEIKMESFQSMASTIIGSNLKQRKAIPRLESSRVQLIVVAVLLMNHVIQCSKTDRIIVSPYALKEGIIAEYFNF